jgi:hypothetical protein
MKNYDQKNDQELRELAQQRGVDVSDNASRDEIVQALQQADQSAQSETSGQPARSGQPTR